VDGEETIGRFIARVRDLCIGGFPFRRVNSRQGRSIPFIPPFQAISRIAHLRKYSQGVTSQLGTLI
jgi:hypothetical protein